MRIALLSLATLALLPAAADAATVKVVIEPPDRGPWAAIDYRAAAGETNRLEFVELNDTTVRVVDPGAVITPGAGCTATNAHTVVCTTAGFANEGLIFSNVLLGDMNDTANSHETGLTADGGPGDDRLESSSLVNGTLNGGGGHDVLLGGANEDTLIDGDRPGEVDSDILDGRKDGAIVSYEGRTAPVTVNLTTLAPAGEAGEGDVLRSITGATGGAGDDVLRGTDRRNVLSGGDGSDRIFALGGQDFVSGGPGDDRLSSGSGDDSVYGEPGDDRLFGSRGNDSLVGGRGHDRLSGGPGLDYLESGDAQCGRGVDSVRPSAERNHLRRDCERALFDLPPGDDFETAGIDVTPYPVARSTTSVTLETSCPSGDLDGEITVLPFRGTVTLKANGHLIGRTALPRGRCKRGFSENGAPDVRIPVALNRRGRRLLSDNRPTDVTIAFRGRNVPRHPFAITLP
ncbi:MAG TPA: calcium-binding protein [Solirubrobacteraceae bacterium]|nr:calcium-binding protein [Solirubrobacteraceae bacterium]